MFRNSDVTKPKYHETYTNKPNTHLHAMQSQVGSDSDDNVLVDDMYNREKYATTNDKLPAIIPTTYDHYYDPENPNADWSGTVKSISQEKKHMNSHRSNLVNIAQTEHGIVSVPVDKYAFHKKRIDNPVARDSGAGLIGGIVADDPYKTTYKSLTDHSSPSKPECNRNYVYEHDQKQNNFQNDTRYKNPQPNLNAQVAFKYESQRILGKSLISNIGSSVASSLSNDMKN